MQIRDLPGAARLKIRVKILSFFLRSRGINCIINSHFRSPKTAHRWSTAFHIASGKVKLCDLRRLTDGRDSDGNLWYCRAWDNNEPEYVPANTAPEIVKNAFMMGPMKTTFAAEGYEPGDSRRFPNLNDVPVSRHVSGAAIDLIVDWSALNGPWSKESIALIHRFGLKRPFPEEYWHVELGQGRHSGFSYFQILKWWFLSNSKKTYRHGPGEKRLNKLYLTLFCLIPSVKQNDPEFVSGNYHCIPKSTSRYSSYRKLFF